jgi:hypothetical protein
MSDSNDGGCGCLLLIAVVVVLLIIGDHCGRMDRIEQQLDSIERRLETPK